MSSVVQKIKDTLDIVTVVSSYMPLEKTGSNFKGKCPFHHEKTPSFFVSPERNTYYCFGCQAKGDIFTFVQEFEGFTFAEALRHLGHKAGVEISAYEKKETDTHARLYTLLEEATLFFERNITSNTDVKKYLYARGLTDETLSHFRVGFATGGWRDLHTYLTSKGYTNTDMQIVGLVKTKEGGGVYDVFRDRIMFPISDPSGRVIAFSGRTVRTEEGIPKYLNSPETVLFNKSKTLFGFDKAKKDIRNRDYAILVEGQMDLLLMHQSGFSNTVASSGTALTMDQVHMLQRLSTRLILAFDNDGAGFKATDKNARLALSAGMEIKVARFPQGMDPADLAKENVEELKKSIASAQHIILFYTESLLLQKVDPHTLSKQLYTNVLPYIALLESKVEQNHFIKRIAELTYLKEEALWDDLKKIPLSKEHSPPPEIKKSPHRHRFDDTERKIIGILWWQEHNTNDLMQTQKEETLRILGDKLSAIQEKYLPDKDTLLFEIEAYYNDSHDVVRDLHDLSASLEEEYLKQDLTTAMMLLQQAEQLKDTEKVHTYLQECQTISQKIHHIKQRHEKTK